MLDLQDKIKLDLEKLLQDKDIDLVEFKITPVAGGFNLYCIVDHPYGGITIQECADINKQFVEFLDRSKILGEYYTLEVNSPGLDRKLINYKDFLRVKGRVVCLWLSSPIKVLVKPNKEEDRNYLEGQVLEVNERKVSLQIKNLIKEIDFNIIKLGKEKIEI